MEKFKYGKWLVSGRNDVLLSGIEFIERLPGSDYYRNGIGEIHLSQRRRRRRRPHLADSHTRSSSRTWDFLSRFVHGSFNFGRVMRSADAEMA